MTLSDNGLNALDRELLDILSEGRVTPRLAQKILASQGNDYTRQYVGQRLKRLAEHSHVRNLLDTGVYELIDDPREN